MSADDPPEPVVLPIEDTLDLHPFQPREVKELLDDYLVMAHEKGIREVRIIHGKGSGVLRARVLSLLKKHPLIMGVRQADASGGGWGATVAVLKSGVRVMGMRRGEQVGIQSFPFMTGSQEPLAMSQFSVSWTRSRSV